MKNKLLIITLLLFQFRKNQEIDLSDWKIDSIPTSFKALNTANRSKYRWNFNNVNGT